MLRHTNKIIRSQVEDISGWLSLARC